MSQGALARAAGLKSQGTIGNIESGTRGYGESIVDIARALDVTPDYLRCLNEATNEGVAANTPMAAPGLPEGAVPVDPSKFRRIWVVGKGAGGLPERVWTDGDYPVGVTEQYGEVLSADPQAFLTEVVEDSMIPVFNPRNFVLVEPNTVVDLEDRVLVRLKSGATLIKRLLSRSNGCTLGSYNDPKLLHFDSDEITWMYYIAFEVPRKKIKSRT